MPSVKDIMNKSVQTTKETDSTLVAAKIMSVKHISCVVIVEKNEPIGILTRRDILEKVVMEQKKPEETKVIDIMSKPVATIEAKANVLLAAAKMNLNEIKQLPVTEDGKLVGIITQTDLVRNINNILGKDLKQ